MTENTIRLGGVLAAVARERERQDAKFPPPPRPDHSVTDWIAILGEEFGEASEAAIDIRWFDPLDAQAINSGTAYDHLRDELVQVAAVAVAFVEHVGGLGLTSSPLPTPDESARLASVEGEAERLREALRRSKEHHEYCGYGDSWERGIAKESGLIDLLDSLVPEDDAALSPAPEAETP